jgi:hypothetical protein
MVVVISTFDMRDGRTKLSCEIFSVAEKLPPLACVHLSPVTNVDIRTPFADTAFALELYRAVPTLETFDRSARTDSFFG